MSKKPKPNEPLPPPAMVPLQAITLRWSELKDQWSPLRNCTDDRTFRFFTAFEDHLKDLILQTTVPLRASRKKIVQARQEDEARPKLEEFFPFLKTPEEDLHL